MANSRDLTAMSRKLILWYVMWLVFSAVSHRGNAASSVPRSQNCGRYCGRKLAVYPNSVTKFVKGKKGLLIDLMKKSIASKPITVFVGSGTPDVESFTRDVKNFARRRNAMYLIAVLNIPEQDCNSTSGVWADRANEYRIWITKLSRGLKGGNGIVVVEPDALALADCSNKADDGRRFSLIKYAAGTLKEAGANVYIDAGNPGWHSPQEAAKRLERAGVYYADGFAINAANAHTTRRSIEYGNNIVKRLKERKGFVIDVSRNGAGTAKGAGKTPWCNNFSWRLGQDPTLCPAKLGRNVDALLWIKVPGESDGTCNGGPRPGRFYPKLVYSLLGRA